MTDAAYKPFGPLHTLDLGNGLVETHDFDGRYYPTRITVAGASTLLDWDYDVDAVGNVTYIDDLLDADPANDRDYGCQGRWRRMTG